MSDALNAIQSRLIGHFFTRLEVGDQWSLMVEDGTWITAHDIAFPEEASLTSLMAHADPPILDGVDTAHAAKAALACRCMRRTIGRVTLDSDACLELQFEDGRVMSFPTRTAIVDWQWVVNEDRSNPYAGSFIAACLFRGKVSLDGNR